MFAELLKNFLNSIYLTFSDGAKFALIARNLHLGNGFTTDFTFWGNNFYETGGISIALPYIMSFFMRLFGTTDFSVIAFSFTFYLLIIVSTYLLANKIFGKLAGLLSAIAVAANYNFIDYATSGAAELLFTFEIIISAYLLSFKKWWINALGFLMLGIMYFSRPQAIIFIAGLFLYWLILKIGLKKALIYSICLGVIGYFVDTKIIYPLSFKYPVTPIFMRGLQSILTYSSSMAVSDGLRGAVGSTLTTMDVLKKVFYNLYNFYKAMPEIMNPYLFALFVIGFFRLNFKDEKSSYYIATVFMATLTFLVTALTIPFYRYLHPVVPLIYIGAVGTLVEIVREFVNRRKLTVLISTFLIFFFCVGQTLGILILDSRFEKNTHNIGKAPIYAVMSWKLKEITGKDDTVLTNLDTWGSWYGERKTIWFPLKPEMILPVENKIDYIYLTSYKMNDDNYYMGKEWREIFENPKKQKVLPDYLYVGEYMFKAEDNYQREDGKAVLLKRIK